MMRMKAGEAAAEPKKWDSHPGLRQCQINDARIQRRNALAAQELRREGDNRRGGFKILGEVARGIGIRRYRRLDCRSPSAEVQIRHHAHSGLMCDH